MATAKKGKVVVVGNVPPARDWGWLKMPEEDKEARKLETTALTVSGEAGELIVKDEVSLQIAQSLLVRIAEIKKGIQIKRDMLLKPIKEQLVRPMEKFFRMMETPIKEADEKLRRSIIAYRMEKKEEERVLKEILGEEEEDAMIPVPYESGRPPAIAEMENGKVGAVTVWKHQVEDETLIPTKVLLGVIRTKRGEEALDQVIRSLIAAGAREIPGVRIYETEALSVTAFE